MSQEQVQENKNNGNGKKVIIGIVIAIILVILSIILVVAFEKPTFDVTFTSDGEVIETIKVLV